MMDRCEMWNVKYKRILVFFIENQSLLFMEILLHT